MLRQSYWMRTLLQVLASIGCESAAYCNVSVLRADHAKKRRRYRKSNEVIMSIALASADKEFRGDGPVMMLVALLALFVCVCLSLRLSVVIVSTIR